jgi:histidinol phosphatase-like PHP family hydrolase
MLHLPHAFEETVKKRANRINAIISNKDIYKLKTLDFIRFFWGAARTKLLARFLDSNGIYIPITSKKILAAILQSSPDNSNWLAAMHGEYLKELRGEASEAYRFFSSSLELLSRI